MFPQESLGTTLPKQLWVTTSNRSKQNDVFQPSFTSSKLTIETLEQDMKYVQS